MNTTGAPAGAISRRQLLQAGVAAFGGAAMHVHADDIGRVRPPIAAPALRLRGHDGRATTLTDALRGHATVVQLMFTGCSAICPLQGVLFASLQATLPVRGMADVQLLSLSIDPLGDDPKALHAWLGRFAAGPAWRAAAPAPADLDRLLTLLGRDGLPATASTGDRHSGRLSLFDREARLVWRTADLPPTTEVIDALRWLRGQG
ncbi:SCO family protein [Variovorax sp. N23]|uniref:SCO family protein n=1 Tax=Variovorax sp. N23 TaxID=2980555 RepID=UPI0021C82D6E|nr:SCO family protein [Variovorax sp. N23]MCU4121656.1 SCO family protein [Variovorax sp. N23]